MTNEVTRAYQLGLVARLLAGVLGGVGCRDGRRHRGGLDAGVESRALLLLLPLVLLEDVVSRVLGGSLGRARCCSGHGAHDILGSHVRREDVLERLRLAISSALVLDDLALADLGILSQDGSRRIGRAQGGLSVWHVGSEG